MVDILLLHVFGWREAVHIMFAIMIGVLAVCKYMQFVFPPNGLAPPGTSPESYSTAVVLVFFMVFGAVWGALLLFL